MLSIVLLTYNSSIENIRKTLESIVPQSLNDFELIISDDCSSVDIREQVETLLHSYGISNYKYIRQQSNVGTVKNLLSACKLASGKYIKPIGAGDLFFCEQTLLEMVTFMESKCSDIAFGMLRSFSVAGDNYCEENFSAPRYLNPYIKSNNKKIKKMIIVVGDWISGASLFYKREFAIKKLEELSNSVVYCEDLIQVLAVIDGTRIDFFPKHVVWYEYGVGFSTNGEKILNAKLAKDHDAFFSYVNEKNKTDLTLIAKNILNYIAKRVKNRVVLRVIKGVFFFFLGCLPINDTSPDDSAVGFLTDVMTK